MRTRRLAEADNIEPIKAVNWAHLEHAYGRAVDTPRHLAALRGDDRGAVARALDHLDVAVLHQGFAFPATAPVMHVVAGYLDERSIRGALLEFLGSAAEATVDIERGTYGRELLPDLHEALVATYHRVYAYVDDPELRTIATAAAVSYVRCAPLHDQRSALGALLRRRIADGEKRAWHVAKLNAIGGPVAGYLDDPELDVRITAALAPELAGDANATQILIAGLTHAAAGTSVNFPVRPASDTLLEYANSFLDPDPWRGYTLGELIAAVIARVHDFDRIAAPAAQLVRTASWTGADRTWGPLVRAAFPAGPEVPLTRAQRLVLDALVNNPDLWRPNDGNAALVFKQAGLPRDRGRCRQILA